MDDAYKEDLLSLFHHNPPHQDALQLRLFVNRKADLEIMGARIPGSLPCIRAIHGGSRVGKSHLALCYLQGLAERHHVFKVIAAGGHTARMVLKGLYQQLKHAIHAVEEPVPLEPEGVGSDGMLEEARELSRLIDEVIPDGLAERPKEVVVSRSFEGTNTFGFAKNVLNLTFSSKEASGTSSKFTVTPPDDYSLSEVLRRLCDYLYCVTGRGSVIYIDDIDLLDVRPVPSQDQVVLLVRLLYGLASASQIGCVTAAHEAPPLPVVVASLRSRHLSIGHKELSEVIKVKPLTKAEFRKVYRAHVQAFRGGQDVFDEACLTELVDYTWGEIGTFLSVCRRFFTWGWRRHIEAETGGRLPPLTSEDLKQYLQDELGELMGDPNLSEYVARVRAAVNAGQLEVALDPGVLHTELVRWLVHDPATTASPERFRIRQLAAQVLRAMEGTG